MKTNYKIHTDDFHKRVLSTLVTDFRSLLDDPSFAVEPMRLLKHGNIAEFRNFEWNRGFLSPNTYFKAKYQMESYLKRYRFKDDLYTDEQLENIALDKFCETQDRIRNLPPISPRAKMVVTEAAKVIAGILGDYDENEHISLCRFGSRASDGCKAKESYLDSKFFGPITGSRDHLDWFFDKVLPADPLLEKALDSCVPAQRASNRRQVVSSLKLTNVPKSFKALRSIMPNTLVGGFYSYGLGKLITKALKKAGLDIRFLQDLHKKLVVQYSRTRSHVTADLSAASDSFTTWLMRLLLPKEWFNALNFGRIKFVTIKGRKIPLTSFMTMGIGFTFPLQTLCFFGLLRAIQNLTGIKGRISVYGDDLIYPKEIHRFVVQSFGDIGFLLNKEKSFVHQNFRESCGADAYFGIDVRPYQPEGQASELTKNGYTCLLYKTINGLLQRWKESEIPQTFRWLQLEILRCNSSIFQVPPDFPEYSGIRTDFIRDDFLVPWAPVRTVKPCIENGWLSERWSFSSMKLKYNVRPVKWQTPFLWESLRCSEEDELLLPYEDTYDNAILKWVKVTVPKWRSSVGCRYSYRLLAVYSEKLAEPTIISQTSTTNQWN